MNLKDITSGLRSGEEGTRQDERQETTGSRRDDSRSTTGGSDDASANRTTTASDGPSSAESTRDDGHVCSFCQNEFDADRGVCPECDAEIVVRGTR